MDYYLAALKKYATFSGRAQRKEYWYFILFQLIIFLIFLIALSLVEGITLFENIIIYLLFAYYALTFIPFLAVTIRRLHDTGSSAWALLLRFIPLVGELVLISMLVSKGTTGENSYGANPKELENKLPSEAI